MTREEKIISIVSKEKKVEVNQLATVLNVSAVTIRKDLDKLEQRGLLHREHGFAVINNQNDINYRLSSNYDLKRQIARKAAEMVKDGEIVIIESGSTCALLAEELAFKKNDVTVITNSSFIASYIRKSENVRIILLGGEYQKDSQVNVGPLIKSAISDFRVDKMFMGIDGFDKNRGFTATDLNRSETTRTMSLSANKTIILTDSSKFEQLGIIKEFGFDEIHAVYTDSNISPDAKKFLIEKGIKVIIS